MGILVVLDVKHTNLKDYYDHCRERSIERLMNKVKKTSNGCWLFTGSKNKFGYGLLNMKSSRTGTSQTLLVHRLAWELLVGEEIPIGLGVLHKCPGDTHNRNCINPEHLYLGTQLDNAKDMVALGTVFNTTGRETAIRIREDYEKHNMSLDELATKYGEKKSNVWAIVRRKTWKHLPGGDPNTVPKAMSKITEDTVRQIRADYDAGHTHLESLGKKYGLTGGHVWKIAKRLSWKHVA